MSLRDWAAAVALLLSTCACGAAHGGPSGNGAAASGGEQTGGNAQGPALAGSGGTEDAGTGSVQGEVRACAATPEASSVRVTFGLTCMPETFDIQATLSQLRLDTSPGMVKNATFAVAGGDATSTCGAPPSVSYRGLLPPGLVEGETYQLQGWFNKSDAQHPDSVVALRDGEGRLLAGWFWQATEHLGAMTFLDELGLVLSSEPGCAQADECTQAMVYNSLRIDQAGESTLLAIGDQYMFDTGDSMYSLGLNGGARREGPLAPGCFDVRSGDNIIFAVARM